IPDAANEISSTRLSTTMRRWPIVRPDKKLAAMEVSPVRDRVNAAPEWRSRPWYRPPGGKLERWRSAALARRAHGEAGRGGAGPAGHLRGQPLGAQRAPADATRAERGAHGQAWLSGDEARLVAP